MRVYANNLQSLSGVTPVFKVRNEVTKVNSSGQNKIYPLIILKLFVKRRNSETIKVCKYGNFVINC